MRNNNANINGILTLERVGDALLIVPTRNLRELEFATLNGSAMEVLQLLEGPHIQHVVVDFQHTDFFGSSAVSFFLRVWRKVRDRGGSMVLCNVSPHEAEILAVCGLNFWPICESRREALERVHQAAPATA